MPCSRVRFGYENYKKPHAVRQPDGAAGARKGGGANGGFAQSCMAPGEEKTERYIDLIMVLNSLRIPSGGAAGGGARSCSCFCGRNHHRPRRLQLFC